MTLEQYLAERWARIPPETIAALGLAAPKPEIKAMFEAVWTKEWLLKEGQEVFLVVNLDAPKQIRWGRTGAIYQAPIFHTAADAQAFLNNEQWMMGEVRRATLILGDPIKKDA